MIIKIKQPFMYFSNTVLDFTPLQAGSGYVTLQSDSFQPKQIKC